MNLNITHTTCNNVYEVEDTLNRWKKNGWVLNNVFIQMMKNGDGSITIFYEAPLDDDARMFNF